jgi:hypothetical protein
MRLTRSALLSIVLLLTAVGSATNDGAWVLWVGGEAGVREMHTWPLVSRQECDVAARGAGALLQSRGWEVVEGRPELYEAPGTKGAKGLRYGYYCLPTGFDPRGPKAK